VLDERRVADGALAVPLPALLVVDLLRELAQSAGK